MENNPKLNGSLETKKKLFRVLGNINDPFSYMFLPKLFFIQLGFTPCKAEQPLQGMELHKRETQKN